MLSSSDKIFTSFLPLGFMIVDSVRKIVSDEIAVEEVRGKS